MMAGYTGLDYRYHTLRSLSLAFLCKINESWNTESCTMSLLYNLRETVANLLGGKPAFKSPNELHPFSNGKSAQTMTVTTENLKSLKGMLWS